MAWPPKWMDPIRDKYAEWNAWYSGEPSELSKAYGGGGVGIDTWVQNRPSQYRGGVFGALARAMWGSPIKNDSSDQNKLHIPIASDIAAMSADLLFGEPPSITIDKKAARGVATKKAVEDLEDKDGLWVSMREGAEVCSAGGSTYLVSVWDDTVHDRPWVTVYPADVAAPEFVFGRLRAVTFWRVLYAENGGAVWRHLERHDVGVISHGLYEGTQRELGELRPLDAFGSQFPDMQTLAAQESAASSDRIVEIDTGIDRLTVEHVPNMLPNRIWRTIPGAAALGRSDYSGIENPMAALDIAWTSWMRDIRLARSRLIGPQSAVQSIGKGQGGFFDTDSELLLGLNLPANPDQEPLQMIQFNIRVEEHERTTQALKEAIVRGAGYSIQAYSGTTAGAALTATEVAAHQQTSLMTRDRKIQYFSPAVKGVTQTHLLLLGAQFGSAVDAEAPLIEFPDGVSESPQEIAAYIAAMDGARAISTWTKVERSNPDWDEPKIKEEVGRIEGSDLAQQAGALLQIGNAMTAIGTAVQLGTLPQADADKLIARVTGVDVNIQKTDPKPTATPAANGRQPAQLAR